MAKRTSKKSSRSRRRPQGGGASAVSAAPVAAPTADELRDLPTLAELAPSDERKAQLEQARERIAARMGAEYAASVEMGCVVRLDRGFPMVALERGRLRAEHSVVFAKGEAAQAGILPAVGDWVAVAAPADHDMAVIEEVLERKNAFSRWRGKKRGEKQVLAANIDTVLIVQALGAGELLLDRIARSLVLALDCDALPAVVLTKADRLERSAVDAEVERVRHLVGEDVPLVVTSSLEGAGLDAVRALVPAGSCAMILGESGAGKSTLLNALLGHEALATGDVRARDDSGRHTTVARVMVKIPGEAGVIADAPGLRSLPLVGHERGLARAFVEIVEAARGCRFNDCTHTHEPGCEVRAAVEAGEIDEIRVESFLALAREMRVSAQSLDPDIHL